MREPAGSQGSISPMFETAIALEEAREGSLAPKGSYPNVDCHSGILYRETGIPPDQFTSLFASQVRPVGWCTGESRFLKTVSSVRHGCIRDTNRANMSRLRNANNRYRGFRFFRVEFIRPSPSAEWIRPCKRQVVVSEIAVLNDGEYCQVTPVCPHP